MRCAVRARRTPENTMRPFVDANHRSRIGHVEKTLGDDHIWLAAVAMAA